MSARVLGAASERLDALPALEVRRAELELDARPLDGQVLLPSEGEGTVAAVRDGNRSVIVPGARVRYAGRNWFLSVKGAGAAAPLYGGFRRDDLGGRAITGESWMGEAPYGAQGELGASQALENTALAGEDGTLAGAAICPTIAVVRVPDELTRRDVHWYRRHRGPLLQEQRLVPSDVRLFHGSELALGRDPERVLEGLGVHGVEALDAFVERFLASGIAALTLWARTVRPCPGGLEGLDFDDAWLDKDALIAPDGTLMLVDLEAFTWRPTTHRDDAEARVRAQIGRNAYELLYGVDALLEVRDAWREHVTPQRARRESVIARLALALGGDRVVRVVESDEGADLEVRVPESPAVRVRLIDRR